MYSRIKAIAFASTLGVIASGALAGGQTLNATWTAEPRSLVSLNGSGTSSLIINTKILERLVRQMDAAEFAPELAESWRFAEDNKSLDVTLRSTSWHDGVPFTAQDVAFTLERVLRDAQANATFDLIEKVEVTGEHSVRIVFSAPVPRDLLMANLASSQATILPKHLYDVDDPTKVAANNAPVGTGPFRFVEWQRGSHIELARNENYWDGDAPKLDGIFFRFFRDAGSRAAAMEAGEVHIANANAFPAAEIQRLVGKEGLSLSTEGYATSKWQLVSEMNTHEGPFSDPAVRRAVAHGIDKNFIANVIYAGLATPATGPVPQSLTAFYTDDVPNYPYDPAKAAKMLDDAGYAVGDEGHRFSVRLVVSNWYPENPNVGQYLKQALEDLAIDVDLQVVDGGGFVRSVYCGYQYDLSVTNAVAAADPMISTTYWYTTDGIGKCAMFRNASRYSNPEMDALIAEAGSQTDPAARQALMYEFQRLAMQDVPILHLVDINVADVISDAVTGVPTTTQWLYDSWKEIDLK